MSTLNIHEVQTRLSEVIDQLRPGDEVVITRGDLPVARLIAELPAVACPSLGVAEAC